MRGVCIAEGSCNEVGARGVVCIAEGSCNEVGARRAEGSCRKHRRAAPCLHPVSISIIPTGSVRGRCSKSHNSETHFRGVHIHEIAANDSACVRKQ